MTESERQLVLPSEEFSSKPVVVSASRRTELVALKPEWLTHALQNFPKRYKKEIHSVVLWTKDPTNIYEHKELRDELSKYNLIVHCTITGLGGTRIEPAVLPPEKLIDRMQKLLDFLGDTRRFRWRFDPIITLEKQDRSRWSSSVLFESLTKNMAKLGIDNCYFSFCQIYLRKFLNRRLKEAGIKIVNPESEEQVEIVENMEKIASQFEITLYSCAQPLLEKIPGITPAKCIDAEFLTELHPHKLPTDPGRDKVQSKYRPSCYCTESRDIGGYLPCGHGCAYCYAETTTPSVKRLLQKPLPWK